MKNTTNKINNLFNNKHNFSKPYIIAEAGVNHEGSIDLAKRLIYEAKEGGANAIKFQTYKASTLACKNSPSYWDLSKEKTKSQYQLFQKYDKFWKKEFEELKKECDIVDIDFMSTPFDIESSIFLNDLMDVFKISSSDITNKPFIEFICDFNKPIILSTGASYINEIEKSVNWIKSKNNKLALLHCVLNYPTDSKNANLSFIFELIKHFPELTIGYSDHTLPNEMESLLISSLLGARIIEKHFTHDKSLSGNDHYHAMDMNDLKLFNKKINHHIELIGNKKINERDSEDESRKNARRSLVLKGNIKKGEVLTYDKLTWKRPASGISPLEIDKVIGKKVVSDLRDDTILQWDYLI